MEEAMGGAQLIQLMIQHQDLLWTVRLRKGLQHLYDFSDVSCDINSSSLHQIPNFLLAQVRQLNQASNQKQLILSRTRTYLLKKKKNQNDGNQVRIYQSLGGRDQS